MTPNRQVSVFLLSSCFILSLFILTDSLGTQQGRKKLHDRHRRAAGGYNPSAVPNAQARYQQSYPTNQYLNQQQQQAAYQNQNQNRQQIGYGQFVVPTAAAYPAASQYGGQQYVNPGATAGAYGQPQQQTSINPAYSASALYGGTSQGYAGAGQSGQAGRNGYAQPKQTAYPAQQPNAGQFSYPSGAYPVGQQQQNSYAAGGGGPGGGGPGPGGFPTNFQAAASNIYGGFNPYGNTPQFGGGGGGGAGNNGYGFTGNGGGGQGRAAPPPQQQAPLVTPAPAKMAEQYTLAEFCKNKEREPKCKKNSWGMCDSDENYPSEVATEFYGYHKSIITAMATDYDYSNSDQYDTGFASQQNKLIDFVHEIFEDNEYGNLPGVPPIKKGLCLETSDIMQPGWAKTSRGKYTVVMNSNKIKQSVRAGICKNAGKSCQDVPKCYKSECRQRFRYDTLLVFDPCDARKPPLLELFKIPDGCECFVLQEEPDLVFTGPTGVPEAKPLPTTTKLAAKGRSGDFATAALIKATQEVAATIARPSTPIAATTVAAAVASSNTVTAAPTSQNTVPSTTLLAATIPITTVATTFTLTSTAATTTSTSGGIAPRSSLNFAPRSIQISGPGSASVNSDLKAL